jgi:hypothetical protein
MAQSALAPILPRVLDHLTRAPNYACFKKRLEELLTLLYHVDVRIRQRAQDVTVC